MRNRELIHVPIILLVGRWSYKDLAKVLCQRFFQQWSAAPSSPPLTHFWGWEVSFYFFDALGVSLFFVGESIYLLPGSKHNFCRSFESFHQVVIVMTMLTWGFEGA